MFLLNVVRRKEKGESRNTPSPHGLQEEKEELGDRTLRLVGYGRKRSHWLFAGARGEDSAVL